MTRQQRRLSGSRNLPSRNIRSSISIWCWKGPWKNALWGKISTIFPGTIFYSIPNILERYLLSELARSDPMESKPPGDVRHKHGSLIPLLEPGKDPLLDALKNECMEKHTWSSKWLFQVPFYTRYMILHACGTAWHFRYPTAIKSTLPVSPVYSVTLADFSGQEGIVSAQAGWELFQAKVEAPNWITCNSQVYFCCKASLISDRYEEPPRSNTSRTGFPNFCVRSLRSGRPGELVTSRDRILLVRQGRDIFIFQSLDEPWNLFQIANFSLPRFLQTIDTKGERSKLETPKLLCCLP